MVHDRTQHFLMYTLSLLTAATLVASCSFDPAGLSPVTNNTNNADPVCGDGAAQGAEVCDGTDLKSMTCLLLGFEGGVLACGDGCDAFDTSACEGTGPVCGNGIIEGIEVCDATELGVETCATQGFESGTLSCTADCAAFDTSACEGTGPVCGDGVAEGTEVCDGGDLLGESCLSQGYAGGPLTCLPSCGGFDFSACLDTLCGNDTVEGAEMCDGTDLGGADCASQGFFAGTLTCNAACDGFDTSACVDNICGNGAVEEVETCDGTDLSGADCASQGFFAGELSCTGDCMGYDTTACVDNICGNHTIEGLEVCDLENVNGLTCQDFGCYAGSLQCLGDCSDYDVISCFAGHDEDGDGFDDNCDNCPSYYNTGQGDTDGDNVGDACEGNSPITFVNNIHLFDPLLSSQGEWSIYPLGSGVWTYNTDEIDATGAGGTNYVHSATTPGQNYSVEATFRYPMSPTPNYNWAAVAFAWQTGLGGALTSAWECTYEREVKELGLYQYVIDGADTGWQGRAGVTVSTNVSDSQWHKLRAYVTGSGIRCEYSDASGVTQTVDYSASLGSTAMSGQTALRVYRERAIFTSFVLYY